MRKGGMRATLVFGLAGFGVLALGTSAWAAAPTVNAANDSATTTQGHSVTINVLANDTVSGGTLDASTLHVVAGASHGSVAIANGTATYTPGAGFGSDTFGYEVCATSYGDSCDNATVTVTVGQDTGTQGGYGGGDTVGGQGSGVSGTGTGQLPFTGSSSGVLAVLGVAFVGGGALCYRAGRNRTRSATR
ncbi:MAG: conserved repeat domain protein [Actinomycetia bacterium]|nr:conserved repeat domain protein [Actinomycetes bacterium]